MVSQKQVDREEEITILIDQCIKLHRAGFKTLKSDLKYALTLSVWYAAVLQLLSRIK